MFCVHRHLRNVLLIILISSISAACSGKAGKDPTTPGPAIRALAVESGFLTLTLSNRNVNVETTDFHRDMDFYWDDGLVITNYGNTVYDFSLRESEKEHYSAGIIEIGMTTAALGIPLVEGENQFVIFVREDPSFTFYGSIYEFPECHSGVIELPSGFKYAANHVIFRFDEQTSDQERHKVIREQNLFLDGYTSDLQLYVGRIDDGRDPYDVAVGLCKVSSIDFAQVNAIGEVCTDYIPDDPAWTEEDLNRYWAMERVQMPKAWGLYNGGWVENIVLCVADSGIYYNDQYILHEDFVLSPDRLNTFWNFSRNFLDDRDPGEFYDTYGHGTNAAGIAMATGDNTIGLAGMVWNPHLVALRIFDNSFGNEATAFAAAMSIAYIGNHAVNYPNLRLIGSYSMVWWEDEEVLGYTVAGVMAIKIAVVYTYGRADNVLLVASAGNDNWTKYAYPASCPGVISVSGSLYQQTEGLDEPDGVNYNDLVDVCAPSDTNTIFTTAFPDQVRDIKPDPDFPDWYGYFGATSAATPCVAGLVSLVWDKHPDWDREKVTNVIKKSADPMYFGTEPGEDAREGLMGTGRINAYCALATCPCELNDWAEQDGGANWDIGSAITTLSNNTVVVTGSFEGVANFGIYNLTSAGDQDIFLALYNPDGSPIGSLRAGGEDEDRAYGITTLPDNSTVVTGSFEGIATIGGTQLTSAGGKDMFLARYSSVGQPLGGIRAGGDYDVIAYGITSFPVPGMPGPPAADYVVITGEFTGSATFGYGQNAVTLTSEGASDIFVACYNPYIGTLEWAVSAGGTGVDTGRAISSFNNIFAYVTGEFSDVATFGEGGQNETVMTSLGNTDIFIACYSISDGELVWVKQAGGSDDDIGRGITTLTYGSAVVTGEFSSEAEFGNQISMTSIGDTDIFVARYDIMGNTEWAKQAGGTNYDTGYAITALPGDSIWVTGSFTYAAHFGVGGPRRLLHGGNFGNAFIAKYDEYGLLKCAKCTNGTGSAVGWGVTQLSDSSIVITGNFYDELIFGEHELNETALYPAGDYDVFLAKFMP